jgi:hypothetical protein
MPLVDGMLSMKMIRFWERESKNRNTRVQSPKPRVPIIAVVEELREDKRFEYIQSGYVLGFLLPHPNPSFMN